MILAEHLYQPYIPELVEAYAQKGIESYKRGDIRCYPWLLRNDPGAKDHPWPLPAAGAGRDQYWVYRTFGQEESAVIHALENIPAPPTFTLEEIRATFDEYCGKDAGAGAAQSSTSSASSSAETHDNTMFIVQGVGINDLHRFKIGSDGAFVMVASQFDYQEAEEHRDTPVGEWLYDRTQGPQASIEAAAAAIHRKAAKKSDQLPSALKDCMPASLLNDPNFYKEGYLKPPFLRDDQKEELEEYLDEHIGKLRILPQWALCESTGATQCQVFCSAPTFHHVGKMPAEGSIDNRLSKKLVLAQYEAIARMAVIRSVLIGEPINLNLTLVGQGVFKNHPSVMRDAIAMVENVTKGRDVRVFWHAYSMRDQETLLKQAPNAQFTFLDPTQAYNLLDNPKRKLR